MDASPASAPRLPRWQLWILLLLPLATTLYTTWIEPRPYHVRAGYDLEHDYYYRARFLNDGGHMVDTRHPGVPVRALAWGVLALTGPRLEQTQQFFNTGYLLVGLLTVGASWLFLRLVAAQSPPWAGPLALLGAYAWPSFWTYQNQFGSDAFTWIFGGPTVALLWRATRQPAGQRWRALLVAAVALGLCLATKLTFLPLLFAACAGWSVTALGGLRSVGLAGRELVWFSSWTGLSGAFCTWPMLRLMPAELYRIFFVREDSRPDWRQFFREVLPDAALPGAIFALLLLVAGIALAQEILRAIRTKEAWNPARLGPWLALGVLGGFVVLTSGTARTIPGYPGVALRNVWPAALVLPWLILHGAAPLTEWLGRRRIGGALVAAALLLAGITITQHRANLRHAAELAQRATAEIELLKIPGTRLGFYAEWPPLGEWQFHAYGENRYASGLFGAEYLRLQPDFTWIRARDINDASHRASLGKGGIGRRFFTWLETPWGQGKRQVPSDAETVFVGQLSGEKCRRFFVQPGDWTEPLQRAIERRLGPLKVARMQLAGFPFIQVDVLESTAPAAPSPPALSPPNPAKP